MLFECGAWLHRPKVAPDGGPAPRRVSPRPVARACKATTPSASPCHGGQTINVIPYSVQRGLDIRTLQGWGPADVEAMLTEAIGADLVDQVRIEIEGGGMAKLSAS